MWLLAAVLGIALVGNDPGLDVRTGVVTLKPLSPPGEGVGVRGQELPRATPHPRPLSPEGRGRGIWSNLMNFPR